MRVLLPLSLHLLFMTFSLIDWVQCKLIRSYESSWICNWTTSTATNMKDPSGYQFRSAAVSVVGRIST